MSITLSDFCPADEDRASPPPAPLSLSSAYINYSDHFQLIKSSIHTCVQQVADSERELCKLALEQLNRKDVNAPATLIAQLERLGRPLVEAGFKVTAGPCAKLWRPGNETRKLAGTHWRAVDKCAHHITLLRDRYTGLHKAGTDLIESYLMLERASIIRWYRLDEGSTDFHPHWALLFLPLWRARALSGTKPISFSASAPPWLEWLCRYAPLWAFVAVCRTVGDGREANKRLCSVWKE